MSSPAQPPSIRTQGCEDFRLSWPTLILCNMLHILDGSFSLSVLVSVLTMNAVLWKRLGLLDMRS